MFNLFKRWRRQVSPDDSFALGERVGGAMLQDIHLQAEILLPPRRLEMMRILDDKIRAIDFVNDPQFAVQMRLKLNEMAEIWSDQKDQQREDMRAMIENRLGSVALDLAPDLMDQVNDIEIYLQWKKLIDDMLKHTEEVMRLQNRWNAAGKN